MERAGRTPFARRALGRVLYWAPVWLALLFALQIAGGGLLPALREDRRLAREEERMAERVFDLRARRALLLEDAARLDDPIWRERVRRSLRIEGALPVSLGSLRRADEDAPEAP